MAGEIDDTIRSEGSITILTNFVLVLVHRKYRGVLNILRVRTSLS